jgi:DNA polymerase II large subunit
MLLPYNKTEQERFQKGKRALELIGAEHEVGVENVIIEKENSQALLSNLGIEDFDKIPEVFLEDKPVLEILNKSSKFVIRDKSGSWIGARMGRPEKAKLRKLTGSPNGLFPVGEEGGRMRSVQAALEVGSVKADFPIYSCSNCQQETLYPVCEVCGGKTQKLNYCSECQQKFPMEKCPQHNLGQAFMSKRIDIKHFFDAAVKMIGLERHKIPPLIKGVRGTSSVDHTPENLAKGFLRTLFHLNVNKDGTIRYDFTEMPLTHFKPKEIGTSIEKLKELGYDKDKDGKTLENEEQLIELLPQDVILPACPESKDEKADEVFISITKYIDALLERFYKQKEFYKIKDKDGLIGHLILGLAPHTSAGIIGRIIGFSKTQTCLAHPMWHSAMRRDCEGDETCVILLLDAFINFSKKYLPAHRGATQDAPLVATSVLVPSEIDDMAFDIDVLWKYPLELYEAAEQEKDPWDIKITQLKDRLGTKEAYSDFGFTHDVDDFNHAVRCSAYKSIPDMKSKVEGQMWIAEKIRAVNTGDVARLVIDRHFIRDIKGNLRKFSQQVFRCVKCNEKYRRPPLSGKCLKCSGKIIFTISEGGIIKYLEPALSLAENYNVPEYVKQNLELTKRYIESIFGKETEKQEALGKWFG